MSDRTDGPTLRHGLAVLLLILAWLGMIMGFAAGISYCESQSAAEDTYRVCLEHHPPVECEVVRQGGER